MKPEETVELKIEPSKLTPLCKRCKGKLFEEEISRKQKVCDCCVRKAMESHGFTWKENEGPHATTIITTTSQ